ncbi:sialidase family protein [Labilithrix luteola]|uniref:sialidase family protein n=1 Tax=Labilithrix luteola TaxID=1391654 RepID=UPI000A458811|nr:hypothetical protein [Labilithrix luteola]
MNPTHDLRRLLPSKLGVAFALLTCSFGFTAPLSASCAQSDPASSSTSSDVDSAIVPPGQLDIDGGVDAADDCEGDASLECTTRTLPCEQAAFCTVAVPADGHLLTGVWGSGKDNFWAVGTGGVILRWNGTAWSRVASDTYQSLFAVWGSGEHDVWIAGSRSFVLHGVVEGGTATWQPLPELSAPYYTESPVTWTETFALAAWGTSADDVWIAGEGYPAGPPYPVQWTTVWRSTQADGGAAWKKALLSTQIQTAPAPTIRGLWGADANEVWAVGGHDGPDYSTTHGKSYRGVPSSDPDGGFELTWTEVDTQSNAILHGVWGSGKDDVWAVGEYGTIRHRSAGDPRWSVVPSPTDRHLYAIWGSGPNDVWVVGDYGTILHYDGATWTRATTTLALGVKPDLRSVWGSAPDDVWVVGKGVALHFTGPKSPRPATGGQK